MCMKSGISYMLVSQRSVSFLTCRTAALPHMHGLECRIDHEHTYINCFGGSDALVDTYVDWYASRVPMWCWAASWLPSLRGCTRGTWWGLPSKRWGWAGGSRVPGAGPLEEGSCS